MSFALRSPAASCAWSYRAAMAREWGHVRRASRSGRPDRWFVELWVGGTCHRIRRIPMPGGGSLAIRSRELALEVLESIRAEYRNGRTQEQAVAPYLSPDASELAFGTHWRRFIEAKRRQGERDRQLSAKRLAELEAHERRGHLAPLWSCPIHAIRAGELDDLADHAFAQGLAPKTVWNLTRDVGACLHWLVRRGDLDRAPALPSVRVPDYTPRIPSPATLDAILGAIEAPLRGQYLARGRMGLRPSEAWRADAGDLRGGELVVRGKGDRNRVLPVADELVAWLAEHPPQPFGPLFRNPRGQGEGRWSASSSRRVWHAACLAVGAGDVRENEGLRHAYGTHAAGRGVDLELVRRVMGHTSGKTSARYVRLASAGLVAAMPRKETGE